MGRFFLLLLLQLISILPQHAIFKPSVLDDFVPITVDLMVVQSRPESYNRQLAALATGLRWAFKMILSIFHSGPGVMRCRVGVVSSVPGTEAGVQCIGGNVVGPGYLVS